MKVSNSGRWRICREHDAKFVGDGVICARQLGVTFSVPNGISLINGISFHDVNLLHCYLVTCRLFIHQLINLKLPLDVNGISLINGISNNTVHYAHFVLEY